MGDKYLARKTGDNPGQPEEESKKNYDNVWEPTFSAKYTMEKGVGGFASLYKENRKKVIQSADNYQCQKCLEKGHWTYECTGSRKYVHRDSRTTMLKRKLPVVSYQPEKKKEQKKKAESSSSESDSSDSSDDSSTDSEESEEEVKKKKKQKKSKSKK